MQQGNKFLIQRGLRASSFSYPSAILQTSMNTIQRAYGALLGWFVGDGFGSQTQGLDRESILAEIEGPITEVYTMEHLNDTCGFSSEVSDAAVLMAMSMISTESLDLDHVRSSLKRYAEESGNEEIEDALDKANIAPILYPLCFAPILAIAGVELKQKQLKDSVTKATSLFFSDDSAIDSTYLVTYALHQILNEQVLDIRKLLHVLSIGKAGFTNEEPIQKILKQATAKKVQPMNTTTEQTLVHVFHTLLADDTLEDSMSTLAKLGGNSRLACAIFGSLYGALNGPDSFPDSWIDEIEPSDALETMIKRQTLFKRETIKMEKLSVSLTDKLIDSDFLRR